MDVNDLNDVPTVVGDTLSPAVAVFGLVPYAAQTGAGGAIRYRTFEDKKWTDWRSVPNAWSLAAPALVVFNKKLYLVFRDGGDLGEIWYKTYDGNGWSAGRKVPSATTSAAPALVVYNLRLYVAYRGAKDQALYYSSTGDGINWSGFEKGSRRDVRFACDDCL